MKKLTTIVLGAALLLGSTAYAESVKGYEVPVHHADTNTVTLMGEVYNLHKEIIKDKNKNGTDDSLVQYFKGQGRTKVSRYVKLDTGKEYVWGIRASEDINDSTKVYTLTDQDGDGKMETVSFNGRYIRPKHLK